MFIFLQYLFNSFLTRIFWSLFHIIHQPLYLRMHFLYLCYLLFNLLCALTSWISSFKISFKILLLNFLSLLHLIFNFHVDFIFFQRWSRNFILLLLFFLFIFFYNSLHIFHYFLIKFLCCRCHLLSIFVKLTLWNLIHYLVM